MDLRTFCRTPDVTSGWRRCTGKIIGVLLFVMANTPSSTAAPITVPPGLNPGDHYRLVFVTSAARNGTSPNIADYNDFVTGVASMIPELVSLATTWRAVASAGSVNVTTNIGIFSTPIYTMNGSLASNGSIFLGSAPLSSPIRWDESGALKEALAWTGINALGNLGGPLGGSDSADFGNSVLTSAGWRDFGAQGTSASLSFYAISGDLVAPAPTPEPATTTLTILSAAALISGKLRRRFSQQRLS